MFKESIIFMILVLISSIRAYSQEWEYRYDYVYEDGECITYQDVKELNLGGYIMSSSYYYRNNGVGDFYSGHPALAVFSEEGEVIAERVFLKSGYRGKFPYILETEDNELIAIGAYNPDRDDSYFNYNPEVKDAILYFYRLDYDLNKLDSVEYHIAIDTAITTHFPMAPNEHNGQIILFSLIEDEGSIVGVYSKRMSWVTPGGSTSNDTLFFFRMNYEGEIIQENHVEMDGNYSPGPYSAFSHQLVRAGDNYILYVSGKPLVEPDEDLVGKNCTMMYLDKDLNLVHFRYMEYSSETTLNAVTVKRTTDNTTLISGRCDLNDGSDVNVRILEVNDDRNDFYIKRYKERGTKSYDDFPAIVRCLDFRNEDEIFWCYGLGYGFTVNHDSYLMIEKMDREMRTISEVYYDIDDYPTETWGRSILATKDGGIILVGDTKSLSYPRTFESFVVKYPAEAFLTIEGAHENNLRTAIVYPNPGRGEMNIRTALPEGRIEVYDIMGKVIYKQDITEEVTKIPTEGWAKGMYLWRVYSEGKEAESGKWVKQ